ncbi:MAG: adenylate kinase [Rhodobacteraceae bacterium]|nr:adenylate kinase [Paracoccaceae bacterium]
MNYAAVQQKAPGLRIHITGAAGSGVTTLGAGLARALRLTHLDIDDFYWLPGDVPLGERRDPEECILRIAEAQGTGDWVLSGSLMGWGESLVAEASAILFLTAPTPVRMDRLRAREAQRYRGRIAPGGDMHGRHETFLAWAERYDDPDFRGRSRAAHEDWLARQAAPVLRIDGGLDADAALAAARDAVRACQAA